MKKNYFLLTFVIILSFQSFGQDYDPIIKEGSFWDVYTFTGNSVCDYNRRRYSIGSDTLINNKTYKKLRIQTIHGETHPSFPNLCVNPPYYVIENQYGYVPQFIREDITEKKVYIWTNELTQDESFVEYTLYDFSLNIGETITNSYFGNNGTEEVVVTGISYNSQGKKIYNISSPIGFYTEGFGSEGGIIARNDIIGTSDWLFCYGNAQSQNDCATVLSTDEFTIKDFAIFPNPVKEKLSIHINEISTIKIYSVIGQLTDTFQLKKNTEIDLSNYKKGIYILEISNQQNLKKTLKFIKN